MSQLNNITGDTAYAYDEMTNAISASENEIRAYIKSMEKTAVANELVSKQQEEYEGLMEVQQKVSTAQETLNEATAESERRTQEYREAIQGLTDQIAMDEMARKYNADMGMINTKMREAQTTIDEYGPQLETLQTQYEETSERVVTANDEMAAAQEEYSAVLENTGNNYSLLEAAAIQAVDAQYQANQEMIANSTIAYEQLSEKNQGLVDNLQSMWDGYYESASNMWEVLKDEESLSVDEMIANLQTNQQTIETMAANMGTLRDRFASLGLDTAVLDQLDTMGIEASADIAGLVTASDEQLQQLATAFGGAAQTSTDALYNGLGTAASEKIPGAIQNLIDTTKQGLSNQIAAADWAELGEAEIEGLVEGVEGMTDDAVDAVKQAVIDQQNAVKTENRSHSPSRVYEGFGEDEMAGLMNGVKNKRSVVVSLMQSVVEQAQAPFKNLQGIFTTYGAYAMQGFIGGMERRRGDVISTAGSIANDASSTISNALQIGSPSKLLRKYGAWSIEGLEIGMESREKGIKRMAKRITDTMASIFIPKMSDYSYSGELAIAGGVTYRMDGVKEDLEKLINSINSRPIVVEHHSDINGRNFAKSTTVYVTEEQDEQAKLKRYIEGVR